MKRKTQKPTLKECYTLIPLNALCNKTLFYLAVLKLMAKLSELMVSMTGHTTLVGSSAVRSNNGSSQCGAHSPAK